MDKLDRKIVEIFPGEIVRKDLTSTMKRGINAPTYVLEYLLGIYCSTDDEEIIEEGLKKIRKILSDSYVRSEESERIKSMIREQGEHTIIDKITVSLDEREDVYVARFAHLEISPFTIDSQFVIQNPKLLLDGVWCILKLAYQNMDDEDEIFDISVNIYDDSSPRNENVYETRRRNQKKKKSRYDSPFSIVSLKPIQMPKLDLDEIIEARDLFTSEEWRDLIIRSAGYEPNNLTIKQRWHYLARLVPLIQKNYNLVELGPRSTGKSHLYGELSPYSILMSGGQTTVSNLFYNMSTRHIGLVGHWDCVAFDEVAGMRFKDNEAIQIMKNYMANGSFARGQNPINADASLCFEGNINDSVHNMLKISHLFSPFPEEFNNDSAFFDRIHNYLPGWETPKLNNALLTKKYGFITDCLSEYCHEMRKRDFTHLFDKHYKLNDNFNKRDEDAVRKTFSGLSKLLYPGGEMSKSEIKEILEYAIEGRRRVKEQLKIMAGIEFIDTDLGYIDLTTGEETVVYVSEQTTSTLIQSAELKPGYVFAAGKSINGEVAVYRLENKIIQGNEKMETQGVPSHVKSVKESVNAAFLYFKENAKKILPGIRTSDKNYLLYYADPQQKGVSAEISLAEFIGLTSALANKPVAESMVVVGEIKLSGSMMPLTSVEDIIRVSINAGAKRILLPQDSMKDVEKIPEELLDQIVCDYYRNPIDAARRALGWH